MVEARSSLEATSINEGTKSHIAVLADENIPQAAARSAINGKDRAGGKEGGVEKARAQTGLHPSDHQIGIGRYNS